MISPKDNYLMMLRGEIPEYIPNYYEDRAGRFNEEFLTPQAVPNGPVISSLGVKYIGSEEVDFGAMPDPSRKVLEDISGWRDFVKLPDLSGFDFESYYKDKIKNIDRSKKYITVGGGDYFLTLVSIMGFENALIALIDNPEEVKEFLSYVSDFYIMILKKQIQYIKPDVLGLMDDDSAYHASFFSVDIYREIFKPLHKKHCDIALENNMLIERHDCGHCEQFIPDWIETGVRSWNPAQVTNDLVGIKKKYTGKLAICGGWDNLRFNADSDRDELRAALKEYVDTFAPGGGFAFNAKVLGPKNDPKVIDTNNFIKDFYFDYAYDWYKKH